MLRQHGGPSTHSKGSLGGNLAKAPDEPLPDPAICEVKPGKETTIEVNKDKLGLGLSIVGGSDTLLVNGKGSGKEVFFPAGPLTFGCFPIGSHFDSRSVSGRSGR